MGNTTENESPAFRRPRGGGSMTTAHTSVATSVLANVPKGKGKLYDINGDVKIVDGPFDDLEYLYKLLGCNMIQMVPCTVGNLNKVAVLIMDEEGMYNKTVNDSAQQNVGDQVFGGSLYGNILVLHKEDFE